MLKFIPGILILQVITIALVLFAPTNLDNWGLLRLAIPVSIAGFLTAIWFGSIAAHQRKDEISRLKESHAKERETIRLNAERAKTKLVNKAQRNSQRAMRRSSRQANIKIGLVFAGAVGLGGLLILTQFMSLGLLTLTATGGALGGYMFRIRQEKRRLKMPLIRQDALHINNANSDNTTTTEKTDLPC